VAQCMHCHVLGRAGCGTGRAAGRMQYLPDPTGTHQLGGMDPPEATLVPLAAMAEWPNGPNRFKELRRRGVPKFHAAVAAGSPTGFWRMSGHPAVQQALRNPYFDALGLPRLYIPAQA
jgi:hypothetical protein